MSTKESMAQDVMWDRIETKKEMIHSDHLGNELYNAKAGCSICMKEVPELNFCVEFKFNYTQLLKAEKWARENNYNYKNNYSHLLMDWIMKENVNWSEI